MLIDCRLNQLVIHGSTKEAGREIGGRDRSGSPRPLTGQERARVREHLARHLRKQSPERSQPVRKKSARDPPESRSARDDEGRRRRSLPHSTSEPAVSKHLLISGSYAGESELTCRHG